MKPVCVNDPVDYPAGDVCQHGDEGHDCDDRVEDAEHHPVLGRRGDVAVPENRQKSFI